MSVTTENVNNAYNQGLELFKQDKYKKALVLFNKYIKNNNTHYSTWIYIGICQLKLGNYTDALASFSNAYEICPNNPSILHATAVTLKYLNRYEDAVETFDLAIKIIQSDDYPDAKNNIYNTYYVKAICHEKLGEYETALAFYKKAAAEFPNAKPQNAKNDKHFKEKIEVAIKNCTCAHEKELKKKKAPNEKTPLLSSHHKKP